MSSQDICLPAFYDDGRCCKVHPCSDPNEIRRVRITPPAGYTLEQMVSRQLVIKVDGVCYKIIDFDLCDSMSLEDWTKKRLEVYDSCTQCPAYMLTPCISGDKPIYADSAVDTRGKSVDLNTLAGEGKVVRLDDMKCYRVSTTPEAKDLRRVTVVEVYHDCYACHCYRIKKCGSTETKVVSNNLLDQIGRVIRAEVDGNYACWEVQAQVACTDDAPRVNVIGTFDDCGQCESSLFWLEPACPIPECFGEIPQGVGLCVNDPSLASAVGKYVRVGSTCYRVTVVSNCPDPSVVDFEGPFETCEECRRGLYTGTINVVEQMSVIDTIVTIAVRPYAVRNGLIVGPCYPVYTLMFDYCNCSESESESESQSESESESGSLVEQYSANGALAVSQMTYTYFLKCGDGSRHYAEGLFYIPVYNDANGDCFTVVGYGVDPIGSQIHPVSSFASCDECRAASVGVAS